MALKPLSGWGLLTLFVLLTASFTGCATNPITYDIPTSEIGGTLMEYPYFDDQPTGIAISPQGREFVNFPRWDRDPLYSVAEIVADGSLRPYPDNDWNRWGADEMGEPGSHFVCVQSLTVDRDGNLWILDPASPGFKGVVPGGAKLVRIDLATDVVERVIPFDEKSAPVGSYLNDVRIDPSGDFAFITDSGVGALVVVDLGDGSSRRLLAGHPSTKAEPSYVPVIGGREFRDEQGRVPQIHSDGIALDAGGEYLYYHALTARTLYRIRTEVLKDPKMTDDKLAGCVEKVADTGATDGMLMDSDDNLYLTALEENAVRRYLPASETLETVVRDDRIRWPDSLALTDDGRLYFTDSQIEGMPRFNHGKEGREKPYRMFSIWLAPLQVR